MGVRRRDDESDEEYRDRGHRGYKWGGMILMLMAVIMWLIALAKPQYRTSTIIAGFLWAGLGLAFIKAADLPT